MEIPTRENVGKSAIQVDGDIKMPAYRWPESELVVCGNNSVRSIGPPFHVELPLIFTLTPCFSAVAGKNHQIHAIRSAPGDMTYLPGF